MAENQFDDIVLFEGKTLSNLFQEIYENSTSKKQQIRDLIMSLTPLVEGVGDATLLVPLIKEYLEISVKNDEQLVKLAGIIQRMGANQKGGDDKDLWSSLNSLLDEQGELSKEVDTVEQGVKKVVEKVNSN